LCCASEDEQSLDASFFFFYLFWEGVVWLYVAEDGNPYSSSAAIQSLTLPSSYKNADL